jgi:Holliday junction resolvase RusA-like endonuclease
MKVEFFVEGLPKQRGSKSYMGKSKKTGRAIMVDSCKGSAQYMVHVRKVALVSLGLAGIPAEAFTKPIVDCVFYFPIAKTRMKGKNALKHLSPHRQTPDRDKLLRAIQDALTGAAYKDDALVADGNTSKKWVDASQSPVGVLITITEDSE